jgi:hypothetical protein
MQFIYTAATIKKVAQLLYLKGWRKVIKIKTVLVFLSSDGFHNFWLSFCEENPNKVSASFCENPSSNPIQEACSGFPIAACYCKS